VSKEKAKIEAVLGRKYDIKSQISAGGMGKIYLGIHRSLNKRIAIKIIHQEFRKDDTFRKRFHREAMLAAKLDHPSIVDIYDFGSSKHFDYIIMPFIDGETLKERLQREKNLPISETLDLIATISSALAFAHKNNVVHRDIKPSNILIDKEEHVYLTDFGISKDMGDVDLTHPDKVIGSPRYISPEQITGKKIDGRCDLYALGLVFYEMATGCYPYADRNANAVYYAQVNEVPKRPDHINPDIPSAVSDIIMKLIEKSPDNRYLNGSQILQDIANAKSGIPLSPLSQVEPHVEDQPVTINDDSPEDQANDDEPDDDEPDDDQPTVINVSIKDRDASLAIVPTDVEPPGFGKKTKPVRSSHRRFILFGSGLFLCVVIGYFLLNNLPFQNGISPIKKKESATSSGENVSIDEKQTSESLPSVPSTREETQAQPIQEEAREKESEPPPAKPLPDQPEVSVPKAVSEKPAEKPSLLSIVGQLQTFKESQEAEFVRMWTKKNEYKIGDSIEYHFQSSRDCHLIVILFSVSGEIIQVFPNRYHPDSSISTGDRYDIPSPDMGIKLEVQGPPGTEELFAIISDEPLKIFPFNTRDMRFFVVDGTDDSLLREIHENLKLAEKVGVKHTSFQYAIAK